MFLWYIKKNDASSDREKQLTLKLDFDLSMQCPKKNEKNEKNKIINT